MKRILLSLLMVGVMGTSGWTATIYQGSIASGDGAKYNPEGDTAYSDATLAWTVTSLDAGNWEYVYTWTTAVQNPNLHKA
mgnify:CR=1 FL=1